MPRKIQPHTSTPRTAVASPSPRKLAIGRRLRAVHPGDVLLHEFIEPKGISRYRVAKNVGLPQRRIDLICRGEAAVTADVALRLAALFRTTPELWMNLQAQYDLELAQRAAGERIRRSVVPLAQAA